ncbi:hypothetical protein F2Q69_00003019 [Brassica cretica]|uniref:Uncharacterized protein n=1 Tax=Brassica cretica TaxID=69181 RepID=A0A8S9PAQ9_BRACR|nr:hypothetical protein F2Q69_00003019 [Brassica cretica]
MQVKVFDTHTCTWSMLKTYGKPPVSRGGQSVTIVGKTLVIFGGQDAKRSLLNDLHVLDLETMTWDEIDAIGASPSPRSDHAAAVHAERYLLIFGGGSHATCFGDLHVLDLQTMEWSRPAQQGEAPTPRSGHAGLTIGENWFIVGGGDNKSGASESAALNMSTLTWSVVASVEGRVPLASEGLSLVVSSYNGEDVLVAFGGYNGRYNNEINLLKPSHKSTLQPKTLEAPLPVSLSAVNNATTRDIESEVEVSQESRVREILMDDANAGSKVSRGGQSVTIVGKTLVIFGGQDAKRSLLNDLHVLDLETMTWDEIDAIGVSPSPRSDHAAAVHAERYLLIFGGGSHATCFGDLHVLDLQTMEWSRPAQQGEAPAPRSGHAGVTIGENWFIVGGGDNKSGASESVVLNMSTLTWSVVASVEGRVPLASEGLSLVVSSYNGEDVLVAFGGYNGRYNNEINLLKPSHKSTLQPKTLEAPLPVSLSAVNNATTRDIESEVEVSQESRVREILMDDANAGSKVTELILLCVLRTPIASIDHMNVQLPVQVFKMRLRRKNIAWSYIRMGHNMLVTELILLCVLRTRIASIDHMNVQLPVQVFKMRLRRKNIAWSYIRMGHNMLAQEYCMELHQNGT